jgi:hypothetical protein
MTLDFIEETILFHVGHKNKMPINVETIPCGGKPTTKACGKGDFF